MNSWTVVLDIVVLLGAALLLGMLFERLRQNAVLGYLLAGILLGPAGTGWIGNVEDVQVLAELGVALLLFTIGLEFSWSRLRESGPVALFGGSVQILLTALIGSLAAIALGLPIAEATVVGAALSLSSTAVVLRVLDDRAEIDSLPGRNAFGILLLQDLAVVPLPMRLPIVHPDDQWEFDEPLDLTSLPEWSDEPASPLTAAEAALVEAIGDPMVRRSLGPVEAILAGIAPEGRAPTEWRTSAVAVLESAIERDGQNPSPLLALGRIRIRQGLRTEARILFERGLQIAIQSESSISPVILAELHYERGRLIKESRVASHEIGRVRAQAFQEVQCEQARSSGASASGFASVERLIAWNYLCPGQLERVFEVGFEPTDDGVADLSLMMGSFRAAIDASAGHVGSNVGLLVALADAGRWEDVLAGASRFARSSSGHPYALLLAGLAQQRLGRGEEAQRHFAVALDRLPQAEADEILDITFVIDHAQISEYRRLWGEERRAWEADFWATKDRTPKTGINQRAVEHVARSTYALLRFGSVTSDPGEVWVRFGGPNTVHVVDEGSGQLTEFWDYGSAPDITFVRWVASQTMDLTREGRAYVDDLGKIFPPQ